MKVKLFTTLGIAVVLFQTHLQSSLGAQSPQRAKSAPSTMKAEESMPNMPRIEPQRVYSVGTEQEGEDLLEERGFGEQEPRVRMMNRMMVGGSGLENMDMGDRMGGRPKETQPSMSDHEDLHHPQSAGH